MKTNNSKPRVALCGLGLMGAGMASRLLAAGFPLTVYNRSSAKTGPITTEGAQAADSPREAARHADVVISMVADDVASRGVWLGEQGALAGVESGAVLIESSTLSVGWVAELAAAAAERGCELLDAPVTGSKVHAASGELCFLVGGSDQALEKVRPVLEPMSRAVVHLGGNGSGALLKLINNFLCGVQAASLAEAIAWVEKSGMNREAVLDVLTNGAPGSPLVKLLSTRMVDRDFVPHFLLRLMAKDMGYVLNETKQCSAPSPMGASALKVFQEAVNKGHGDKDFSAVIESYRTP